MKLEKSNSSFRLGGMRNNEKDKNFRRKKAVHRFHFRFNCYGNIRWSGLYQYE